MSKKIVAAGIFSTLVIFCSVTTGQTVINYKDRGQYSDLGVHDKTNSNYLAGYFQSDEYRNFFVFDLTSVAQPIASATLELSMPGSPRPSYGSSDPSENFELHDVVTSISSLTGFGGTAAFNDLANGTVYGNRSVTSADAGTVVVIPLNASAIAAMNSNHGLFAMGGSITTLTTPPTSTTEAVFAFTGAAGFTDTSQLRLTFVPEPTSAALTASFAMIFGMWRSRKRPVLPRCT